MWNELSAPWQAAFEQAWEAYRSGSIPIGAALADETGAVIAQGRSMQYEKSGPTGQIAYSKLSHAELNTLLQVSAHDHSNIHGCTLYTTVEPCPLCFGALVMSNVRSLRFAARDAWAGSTNLLHANAYISGKPIRVDGPFMELEIVSTAINTDYFLRNSGMHSSAVVDAWEKDCPEGVRIGREWYSEDKLEKMKRNPLGIVEVFETIGIPLACSTVG